MTSLARSQSTSVQPQSHKAILRKALPRFITERLGARLRLNGRPLAISHQITNRCMCKCQSCLWTHNDWRDVPTEQVKEFYAQAGNKGFAVLAITGGEPFLRKDLGELVRFAKEKAGMSVILFTTGYFLEKRMHEVLPWVDVLILSLDSAKRERHDEIRGLPGLYDRLMSAARAARTNYPDLSIHLNCCVQKGVEEEIDDLVGIAEELGVKISFDVITEARNGSDGDAFTSTNAALPLAELSATCADLGRRKKQGAPIVNSERYFDYHAQGQPGYRCHLPKLVLCVDGRGNVEDCLDLNKPIANIKESSLKEILAKPRMRQLRCDAEACSSCNSPTMVDLSNIWERPWLLFARRGLSLEA